MRIIISSFIPVHGRTILEKRQYFMEHYDHIREGLLREQGMLTCTPLW
jgi:proline racemase